MNMYEARTNGSLAHLLRSIAADPRSWSRIDTAQILAVAADRLDAAVEPDRVCKNCGKPIVSTDRSDVRALNRQSAWMHADGSGVGVGEYEATRAMWCEGEDGYVKVEPRI